MCERLKQAVLKTAVRETVPGVRIPLPPPEFSSRRSSLEMLRYKIQDPWRCSFANLYRRAHVSGESETRNRPVRGSLFSGVRRNTVISDAEPA